MKKRSFKHPLVGVVIVVCISIILACNSSKVNQPVVEKVDYGIAPQQFSFLAEKSLELLANFDFETWASTLSDDVEYNFPDGDTNSRTKLEGKVAVLKWWKNYKSKSGIQSMVVEDAYYIPIDAAKIDSTNAVMVVVFFSNKMIFKNNAVAVRMNFNFQFNKAKLITRIITYYDRTPIIKASGNDVLQK
jgi:hypothetical protein